MSLFSKSLACSSFAGLLAGLSAGAGALPVPNAVPAQVRQNAPGSIPMAAEVVTRCHTAYAALTSYEVTSNVTAQGLSVADGTVQKYQTSANIQFVRPGKIRTSGEAMGGSPYAYVSDGARTAFQMGDGPWKSQASAELAIAGATGISASAGATVPALLLGLNWGTPLALGGATKPAVREDKIEGVPYYVLTAHLETPTLRETESVWIDEKTFLLRRTVSDDETTAQTSSSAVNPMRCRP